MLDESEGGEEPEWVQHERETFKDARDKNGDGFLDVEEVSGRRGDLLCPREHNWRRYGVNLMS